MKVAILVGDGMADYPLPELEGRTPLEVALTPNMDAIARGGTGGLVRTIPDGMPPGSDVANLSIFGYDPLRYYTGRAPLEAASVGVALGDGEVAFRCNLVTIEDGVMVDYSAGHISTEEAKELILLLDERLGSEEVRFHPGVSYRHLLVIRGEFCGLRTTPPHDITGRPVAPYLPEGEGSEVLRELMGDSEALLRDAEVNRRRRAMGKPPATGIWPWGQGKTPRLPGLRERFGVEGGVISAVDLVRGIGVLAGLRVVDVPGATGYLDTNYEGKASYALEVLREQDFVYLHVEAPDEAGHAGGIEDKIRAIEDFDEKVVGPVWEGIGRMGGRILVLPDHRTPIPVRTHTPEPVPFAIWPGNVPLPEFSESAGEGGLRVEKGHELMEMLIKGR